jgi:hypothetical protein
MRPGMYCKDLVIEEDHPPYWSAVLYWLSEGEPDRMDADRDGIPCETVYPEAFIRDFLEDPSIVGDEDPTVDELDRGMLCRDLIWWMPFYRQALGYFFAEGFPDRMDADGNGVPCETVYEDATLIAENATSFADQIRTTYPENLGCAEFADPDNGGFYPTVAMYWLISDRPSDLDPDGDGYPCSPGGGVLQRRVTGLLRRIAKSYGRPCSSVACQDSQSIHSRKAVPSTPPLAVCADVGAERM